MLIGVEMYEAIRKSKCRLPEKYWSMLRVSEPCNGCSEKEIVIHFPEGGIEHESMSGFFYIPFFTRYVINSKGEIFNLDKGIYMSPYLANVGYVMFGLTNDLGKRTIVGKHRALCLAFKQYPDSVFKLDVNHIDGVKVNNALENLEWATRTRNMDHAYDTGLRSDNIPVTLKSAFTGEKFTFRSTSHCAQALGLIQHTVGLRIRTNGEVIYKPGIYVYKTDVGIDPPIMTEAMWGDRGLGFAKALRIKGPNGVEEGLSAVDVAQKLNISRATVGWRLKAYNGSFQDNDYFVEEYSLEETCKSLFDEIRNKYFPELLETPESLSDHCEPRGKAKV